MTTGSEGMTGRCVCGHPEHAAHCPCGCRAFISGGSHPDQSRSGALPAVIALGAVVALVAVAVAVIVVRMLW
ncbi:MAG: hypothetical protein ACRDTG_19465 [Pseudonocardiaceae bacterium]